MKKLLTFILIISSFQAFAQFKVGAGLNYTTFRPAWAAQIKTSIPLGDKWAIGGTGDFFFISEGGWDINIDAQYRLVELGNVPIMPFAGVNFTDFKESEFSTGINLGVLTYFPITDMLDLYLEPKYLLISSNANGLVVSAGVFLRL